MTGKDIKVKYIHGIKGEDFLELENLGYETEIPQELDKAPIFAFGIDPEDYITIYTIYFSLKLTEEIAKGIANKLISNFAEIITRIWNKHKDIKPAKLTSRKEPEYKLPKAILTFEISKDESTSLEITNEIEESELKQLLETQLELVKMKYKHRKAELKLMQKRNK